MSKKDKKGRKDKRSDDAAPVDPPPLQRLADAKGASPFKPDGKLTRKAYENAL